MTLYIIGAGMAGLLAANMLRKHKPIVLEEQYSLPNNHSAVLRFGTSAVSDVLGIPFKRVNLLKATLPWQNPVADALSYSHKNLGTYESERSVSRTASSVERWIAPDDLISRMAEDVAIRFSVKYDFRQQESKVISTIPMPTLMKMLDYPKKDKIAFRYVHGINVTATVKNCLAFVTLNVPNPSAPFSRVSITGDRLIIELPGCHTILDSLCFSYANEAANLLGINPDDVYDVDVSEQRYHKIASIDEGERRDFIHWASAVRGAAWQVGRFATWRPGLQLDELVKDIRLIERWMTSKSAGYEMERHLGS